MHVNIGTLLPRHATYRPDKTAVILQTHTLTLRHLNGRVNHMTKLFSDNMAMFAQEMTTFLEES